LQGNKKILAGISHPDRDAQFQFIAARLKTFQEQSQPVISVDTKKKELGKLHKNGGDNAKGAFYAPFLKFPTKVSYNEI